MSTYRSVGVVIPVVTSAYRYNDGEPAEISVFRYLDGNLGLAVEDEYIPTTVSVNLLPDVDIGPNQVFIKDYGEGAGVTDCLVASGVAEIIRPVTIGFGTGYQVRLLFDAETVYPRPDNT